MASLVKELIDAGIHFGQRRSNWNPKMKPYIFSTRNQIHIIDIKETIKGILLSKKLVQKTVAQGQDVLFVGTKRQARGCIEQICPEISMPYVTERWLGGTLTNFRTIRDRLKRLEELEGLIESGEIKTYSKKMESQLMREKRKIYRNLNGIRNMSRLPGVVVVVDTNREINAIREARNLRIPTICLIDTDGNPDMADIPIPGNDDSMRSIECVIRQIAESVEEGKTTRAAVELRKEQPEGGDERETRRRSSRSKYKAEDDDSAVATDSDTNEPLSASSINTDQ